ncbi:uncharacterized protein LOC119354221 isoform X5 [Triticum dicoccoides]|uniref:uncharacterized protein LOC119354221 isoform X5 n=1 Tax=Triticum dicoccoides TaxID=85692 RepID=UPI00188E7E65|nr:uncharacterized protein LOC119354221 isoform X5 [Triticum dicoccoides]
MLRAGGGVTTTTYQTRRGAVNENVGLEIQNIQEVVGGLVLNRRQACWRASGRIGEHPLHYFQVNYTEENLQDYIDPNNDTLMFRLADRHLLAECCIMLGMDKRATITTNWPEFRRRANIREGDICAFRFRITSKRSLVLTVHCL